MSKPIIVVFGATGKSGGGMIEAILADGSFAARAVTRNPDGAAGKSLASKGVEVVKADLNDPAAVAKAMTGAYGVFAVTDYWTVFAAEEKQGKDMVDAAKAAGVKHFVWTTLDHNDQWKIPHFETKARVNDYLIASGVPRTSLYLVSFIENFQGLFGTFKRNDTGTVVLDFPGLTDAQFPVLAASDIGSWALIAFKSPDQWAGKDMLLSKEWISPRELAKIASEELGEPVEVKEVGQAAWDSMRTIENFEELWLNLNLWYTADRNTVRDVELSNKLLPGSKSTRDLIRSWGTSFVH